MRYIVDELDADGDGWPEGLGNVEREGMGEEKLDNAVYPSAALGPRRPGLARGRPRTERWATRLARGRAARFDGAWWIPEVPGFADSLDDPRQRSPLPAPLDHPDADGGRADPRRRAAPGPGPGRRGHGCGLHERRASATPGLFHTGRPSRRRARRPRGAAVVHAEHVDCRGGRGQLRPARAAAALDDGARRPQQLPASSSRRHAGDRALAARRRHPRPPVHGRPMVLQAWGAYGTAWPVVHQQLGVRPDLGRGRLEVVPQLPAGPARGSAGGSIRMGDGARRT